MSSLKWHIDTGEITDVWVLDDAGKPERNRHAGKSGKACLLQRQISITQHFQDFLADFLLAVRIGDGLRLLIRDIKHVFHPAADSGYLGAV